MPYRRTDNVVRQLAARQGAIMEAAEALAAQGGMGAVQIAAVAVRANIAAGTVYRYFPSKIDLISALVEAQSDAAIAAIAAAADAAPGPLSALAAALAAFAARALAQRRLASAMLVEPVEQALDAARLPYRRALAAELETRIRAALERGLLPMQDATLAAAALMGALVDGLLGPLAPVGDDPARMHAQVQTLTLFALRGLGIVDARARGLVVQTGVPPRPEGAAGAQR
jgi:AcrR family transcriptional regulator